MAAESEVTHQALLDLWEKQDGKCAMTGVQMTHYQGVGHGVPTNLTIDRIDSKVGYTLGNIRLVCKAANWMKNSMSDAELVEWATLILNGPLSARTVE